jgi:predicted AAA+ superfamily ATPase
LRQYFDDIIERDVRERVGARSSQPLRQLVKIVFESCGSELSLRKLAGATGLTVDTVSTYLSACESAYLLFPCPYFAFSERKRSKRNKKYYPVDTGLRQAVVTRTGEDQGKSFEALVYLYLRKKSRETYYWRGKGEVDFVTNDQTGITPYQVSLEGIEHRHEAALEDFYSYFPQANDPVYITSSDFTSLE